MRAIRHLICCDGYQIITHKSPHLYVYKHCIDRIKVEKTNSVFIQQFKKKFVVSERENYVWKKAIHPEGEKLDASSI